MLAALESWITRAGVGQGPRVVQGARELYWLAEDAGVSARSLGALHAHFESEPLRIRDGCVWTQLAERLGWMEQAGPAVSFLHAVGNLAPTWLAKTPHAPAGRFELFYRMTRPGGDWPRVGDVKEGMRVVEIKGSRGLLRHPSLTGAGHHALTAAAFGGTGIMPNKPRRSTPEGGHAFEITARQWRHHYEEQFASRPRDASGALMRYLTAPGGCALSRPEAGETLYNCWGGAHPEALCAAWLRSVYEQHRGAGHMDDLVVFGDGSDVKVVRDSDDLHKLKGGRVVVTPGSNRPLAIELPR